MIAKMPSLLEAACLSVENALDVYHQFKDMPKTFTCSMVASALGITVNRPALGDFKPFLLSGTNDADVRTTYDKASAQ